MDCTPCIGQVTPPETSAGYCEDASHGGNYYVHVLPNRYRKDGAIHGERCAGRCGCGRLFCTLHAHVHAQSTHGSSMADCFPRIGGTFASGAMRASALAHERLLADRPPFPELQLPDDPLALERGPTFGTASTIAYFLYYVTPGAEALVAMGLPRRDALRALAVGPATPISLGQPASDDEVLAASVAGAASAAVPLVLLERMGAAQLARTNLLAMKALGDAASWLPAEESAILRRLSAHVTGLSGTWQALLDELGALMAWAGGEAQRPTFARVTQRLLTGFAGVKQASALRIVDAMVGEMEPLEHDPRAIPKEPAEVARWILHGSRGHPASPGRGSGGPTFRPVTDPDARNISRSIGA